MVIVLRVKIKPETLLLNPMIIMEHLQITLKQQGVVTCLMVDDGVNWI